VEFYTAGIKRQAGKGNILKTFAKKLKITSVEVGRKLHNLRCQINSELRKIKIRKVEQVQMRPRKALGSCSIH